MNAPTSAAGTPLARLLARVAKVEGKEAPAVLAAFLLFFCVLGGYFAVRPVRETMGTFLGEDRLKYLFTITWLGALAIVPIYGWIVAKIRRTVFLPWLYGFIAVMLAGFAFVLGGEEPDLTFASVFYVWLSVLNLFIVSVFWSFLVEMFSSAQAKRLFGFIAAGGTAGGLVGPLVTNMIVGSVGNTGVLLFGASLFVVAVVCQRALLAVWRDTPTDTGEKRQDKPMGGNPFAGIMLVLKSPYLLAFAAFMVLLASVTTFLYFEQTRLVAETFTSSAERTRVFSTLDAIVQGLAIITQLFLTGRIASRLGVTVLLTAVPLIIVLGFVTLSFVGTFWVLAIVMTVRRSGEYALIRPGREMLFTAVDTETKYKAKNVLDVVVYRGGDAIAGWVKTGLGAAGMGFSGVALVGAGLAALWAGVGFWLGRRYDAKANDGVVTPVPPRH